jgi:hypothetical protein
MRFAGANIDWAPMQIRWRTYVLLAASILLFVHPANAQGYVAPSLGASFANPSAQGRANFGVDLGWLSTHDPIGLDLDAVYAPSFFGNAGPYGDNSVATLMGNVMLVPGEPGGPYNVGRRRARTVRPYISGGMGVMREMVTSPRVVNTDLAVNLGLGVIALTHRSVGVRGDVRYYRDLLDNQSANGTSIDFGSFHFWRASLGVVLAF